MHSGAVRAEALALVAQGLNYCAVARRTGIPRSTIRGWWGLDDVRRTAVASCPRCWESAKPMWFSDSDYAELLGLYLGDGHVTGAGRTYRLRLFLDTAYPGIIDDAGSLLARCFAGNRVGLSRSTKGSTTIVSVYSRHLPCLFPQHGPGKKHERPIVLEDWQRRCVEQAPMNFIRGCIESDGCYFVNRTGHYSYPSYQFANRSDDIAHLFAEACERVGIQYRRYRYRLNDIRINRRDSVAPLLRAIGPKG
jgi:hypothetical protein